MPLIKNRMKELIPSISCRTCGKYAEPSRVIELEDPALIRETRYKTKRKTYNRLIRSSYGYYRGNRLLRNKRIFFSYLLLECIQKRHKLKVQFKEGKKLPNCYADIVIDNDKD